MDSLNHGDVSMDTTPTNVQPVAPAIVTPPTTPKRVRIKKPAAVAPSAEQKKIDEFIVILPCSYRLPEGHLLKALVADGKVIQTAVESHKGSINLNAAFVKTLNIAATHNYTPHFMINGEVNYGITIANFKRDPSATIDFCNKPRQAEAAASAEQKPM